MGRQCFPQDAACAFGATAAACADAELRPQLTQVAATFGNGGANIALGDGIAYADEHDGGYLVKISLPWRVRRKR